MKGSLFTECILYYVLFFLPLHIANNFNSQIKQFRLCTLNWFSCQRIKFAVCRMAAQGLYYSSSVSMRINQKFQNHAQMLRKVFDFGSGGGGGGVLALTSIISASKLYKRVRKSSQVYTKVSIVVLQYSRVQKTLRSHGH